MIYVNLMIQKSHSQNLKIQYFSIASTVGREKIYRVAIFLYLIRAKIELVVIIESFVSDARNLVHQEFKMSA